MPSLLNINGLGNLQNKKLLSKLSFQLGESFSARISAVLEDGTVNIKLLEGWLFNAVLTGEPKSLPEGLVRFKVQGYEEEKLILQVIGQETQEESKEPILSKYLKTLGLSSEEESLINMLLKHNISLSKENVRSFKGLLDIKNNAQNNEAALDSFISKYMLARGIEENSHQGKAASKLLREVFKLIANMDEGDLLTFLENEIPFTKENIKSYQDIFKGWGTIYNDIKEIKQEMSLGGFDAVNPTDIASEEGQGQEASSLSLNEEAPENDLTNGKPSRESHSLGHLKGYALKGKGEILSKLRELVNEEHHIVESNSESISESNEVDSSLKSIAKELDKEEKSQGFVKGSSISADASVKLQLKEGSKELKRVVESLSRVLENGEQQIPEKLHSILLEKSSDFKLFNDISKEYYFLDIPLKLYEKEYPMKLLIKDSRKKGKRPDSKNIKLVVSVATANLGVVDGFVYLSGNNLNITIGAGEKWVKILEEQKQKLQIALQALGYNTDIFVTKKQEDATISNSRDFFNHNLLAVVDVFV